MVVWMAVTLPAIVNPLALDFDPRRTHATNVVSIVPGQFASRRGIISAHCHRLIESGTERIVRTRLKAARVRVQDGTGIASLHRSGEVR